MNLAIVVVSYGSGDLLIDNLAATAAAIPAVSVVVVDNFSTQAERQRVARICEDRGWQLCAPAANLGFGGGANVGIQHAFDAGASEVLLLNPDARIGLDDALLLAGAVRDERLVLVSPRVVRPDGSTWFAGVDLYLDDGAMRAWSRRTEHPTARRAEWLSGACLWITREVWTATGRFDEDYFLYWEDVDYSWRAARAGVRLLVQQDAVAIHDEGATHRGADQRAEAKSQTYYFYNVRNRLVFAAKHLSEGDFRTWRRSATRAAWDVVLRGGRRQLLTGPGPLLAAWRGLREGRREAARILRRSAVLSG